jgi:aldose 1-epimerase
MASLKPREIQNDFWHLTFFPEYGCYWKTLKITHHNEWIDLLRPLEGEMAPFHFGSYVMAPWSNRIVDAVFKFQGNTFQLRKNFPDETAIHGDSRTRPWAVSSIQKDRFEAVLDSREFSDFNFPFALKMKQIFELKKNHLKMSFSIENTDSKHAPVGGGFHPFFKRRLTELDQDVMVVLPAEKVYPDVKCIPTGPAEAVKDRFDLRKERLLGAPNLDHCFTGLTGNVIRVIYPGSQVELKYQIEPVFSHVVIYAPNEADGNPRDFVAVEPVTHVNNGFNFLAQGWKETGVKILEPGEIWGGSCELSYSK